MTRGLGSKMSERSDIKIAVPAPLHEDAPEKGDPERRAQARFTFTASAAVLELRSQIRVTGRCSDLSPGGCYIDTISPFPVGAVVRIRMERGLREFESGAVVTYALASMGMGIAFTEIKPEHQEVLRSWIGELSGENPPEPAVSSTGPDAESVETNAHMRAALSELVTLLVRKEIISESEGEELVRKILR